MAGLGLFDQKIALAVAMPIATAFKFCIGLLGRYGNRQELSFGVRGRHHQSPSHWGPIFFLFLRLRVAPGVGQNFPGIFRDALAFLVWIKHQKI
jgi:hypothetical protein